MFVTFIALQRNAVLSILLLTITIQSGFNLCVTFCTTSAHVRVVYDVGKVPVPDTLLVSENVANHLLETWDNVIVCFTVRFLSVGLVPLGGYLWAATFGRLPLGGCM